MSDSPSPPSPARKNDQQDIDALIATLTEQLAAARLTQSLLLTFHPVVPVSTNGHSPKPQTVDDQFDNVQTLADALAIDAKRRKKLGKKKKWGGPRTAAPDSATEAIRAALSSTPQSTVELHAALAKRGDYPVSRSWLTKLLPTLPFVQRVGTGKSTQWALRSETEKAPKTVPGRVSREHARRTETQHILSLISTSKPTTRDDLFAAGVDVPKKGMVLNSLVRYGYVKKKGEGWQATGKDYAVSK